MGGGAASIAFSKFHDPPLGLPNERFKELDVRETQSVFVELTGS